MASAPSEDSGQPGHPPSLIRVFAVHMSLTIIRAHSKARLIRVFTGRKGHFVGFFMRRLILLCLTCINNTDFCYFEALYFLKLPEKASVFMYPCTCMLVSVYYVILQTSSNTHLYLSRRSTRLTVHIAF